MKHKKITKERKLLQHIFLLICCLYTPLFSHEIIIQSDYWTGTKCLENGVPWQVPDSIYKEDEHCRPEDIVLEFGAGGSTIFFAKRCKTVVTIETNPDWALSVKNQLKYLNLNNVIFICMDKQLEIEQFIQKLDTSNFNILSVDTWQGYNRSAFLEGVLRKGISNNLRMIVLDNYGAPELFPQNYNSEVVNLEEWAAFTYDDSHWWGKGTKIYVRE